MARVSVLFATRNGAYTLPRMLDSLERLKAPTGGWQAVAVDNGSSDESLSILRERAARLPMTVITELRRGKNIALNTGLALVEGDIVAFTDDDIILPADWLVSLESIAAQRGGYDVFGGPIYPVWEEPPPAWLLRCVPHCFFGLTDFAEGPVDAEAIWGGNMAVRAGVFREHRFADSFEMHSETEFVARANNTGHRCWHFHASPVGHIIRPYQLALEWQLARAFAHGRADRRRFYSNRPDVAGGPFGFPVQPAVKLVKGAVHMALEACRIARFRLSGDFESRLKASLQLRFWLGCAAEEYSTVIGRPGTATDRTAPIVR